MLHYILYAPLTEMYQSSSRATFESESRHGLFERQRRLTETAGSNRRPRAAVGASDSARAVLLAGILVVLCSSEKAWTEPTVSPRSIVRQSVERLHEAQERYAAQAPLLEPVVDGLRRVLGDGSAGNFPDCCHVLAPPRGLQVFDEARQAMTVMSCLAPLRARSARSPRSPDSACSGIDANSTPAGLKRTLRAKLGSLLDGFQFLADVQIQEARARAKERAARRQADRADSVFLARGLEARADGDVRAAMSSYRRAWQHAHLALQSRPRPPRSPGSAASPSSRPDAVV